MKTLRALAALLSYPSTDLIAAAGKSEAGFNFLSHHRQDFLLTAA